MISFVLFERNGEKFFLIWIVFIGAWLSRILLNEFSKTSADKDKTTFITPWGRFRYLRAPQGYLSLGDGFTHQDQLTSQAIKNKVTLVDDNMCWDATVEENFMSVCCGCCDLWTTWHKDSVCMQVMWFGILYGQTFQVRGRSLKTNTDGLYGSSSYPKVSNQSDWWHKSAQCSKIS